MYKKCEELLKKLELEEKINVLWDFKFPPKQELKLRLKDMLEDEVDEKYYLSDEQVNKIKTSTFMTNQRRIQEKEWRDTLCARDWKDPKCVQVGTLDIKGHDCIKRVYSDEGISPTLTDMQGGNRQPKVMIKNATKLGYAEAMVTKPRKDIKQLDKYCEYCGTKLERKRFNGRLEDFNVFNNRKYCNKECMRKDWLKIGEHNQSYSNAHTTARKINELILHKEVCELCGNDTNLDIHHIDGNWQNNNLDNLMCLCRSCHTKYEKNKDKEDTQFRVRKLTPLETWRLMRI